jgi:outer membrane receptor protein involved in Fe transport
MRTIQLKLAWLAGIAVAPGLAVAQTPVSTTNPVEESGADKEAQASEIVVTAQRFEQRLQDVPLSVSALTGEELQARGVSQLSDLQYSVPGLSSFDYGPGVEYIQIRGVSNSLGAPTVGVYLDEMPVTFDTQGTGLDIRLLDMERVEVLRGPQATLYGEGAMGGTIRYIAASPDLGRIGGSLDVEYSGTEDGASGYQASGVLNLPIVTDRLGVRVVAGYEKVGGYIDNVVTGQDDVNGIEVKTLRAKILARPSEDLNLSVLLLHQEADQNYQNFGVDRQTIAAVPTFNRDKYDHIQVVTDYDLNFGTLTASAGYLSRKTNTQNDVSPFYVPVLTAPPPLGLGLPIGFVTAVPLTTGAQFEVFNTELRIASRRDGPFDWMLGATYRDLGVNLRTSTSTSPGSLPFALIEATQERTSRSFALYGEIGYQFTPKLAARVGLRYFEDCKRLGGTSVNFGVPSTDVGKDTFDSLNPRFNVSYAFTDRSMVYVNVAKGFRSGGFNQVSAGGGVIPVDPVYEPDAIWTYEFGTKHQVFGNKLLLDAAVYYSDWSDVQSYVFAPGSALTIISNAGQVSGWGVDFSATAKPVKGLTLSASYGWNNLEYDEATADKAAGDPVDGAVRESYSASLDYRHALNGSAEAFFRADYQHGGSSQITLRNLGGQIVERPARDLVNLRAGISIGNLELSAFADNLFDEDAPLVVGPFGVLLENVEQRPRVTGISARVTF